jgi:class 3 adenylate cyclase
MEKLLIVLILLIWMRGNQRNTDAIADHWVAGGDISVKETGRPVRVHALHIKTNGEWQRIERNAAVRR